MLVLVAAALSVFLLTRPERYSDEFLHACSCMQIDHLVNGAHIPTETWFKCERALRAEGLEMQRPMVGAEVQGQCLTFEEWKGRWGAEGRSRHPLATTPPYP